MADPRQYLHVSSAPPQLLVMAAEGPTEAEYVQPVIATVSSSPSSSHQHNHTGSHFHKDGDRRHYHHSHTSTSDHSNDGADIIRCQGDHHHNLLPPFSEQQQERKGSSPSTVLPTQRCWVGYRPCWTATHVWCTERRQLLLRWLCRLLLLGYLGFLVAGCWLQFERTKGLLAATIVAVVYVICAHIYARPQV